MGLQGGLIHSRCVHNLSHKSSFHSVSLILSSAKQGEYAVYFMGFYYCFQHCFQVLTPQKAEPTKGTQVFDGMSKKKQTSPGQVMLKNTRPVKAVKRVRIL